MRGQPTRELGEDALVADRQLADVAASFDYLFYVSPTNEAEAWEAFRAAGSRQDPPFTYRPLDLDITARRHALEAVGIPAADDPAVAALLQAKRTELHRLLDLISARGTSAFLAHSIALSGPVDDDLLRCAEEILARVDGTEPDVEPTVSAEFFAERADLAIRAYHRQDPTLEAQVVLRDDLASLMVSREQVYVPLTRRIAASRVDALVHHEVGTHLLTWWNGQQQPLRLLADGLAAYEGTQEGLGVLAEHLCGGLPPARLGELALRVVAARSVSDGAEFPETFARLHETHGAPPAQAFTVAARVHRSGGLVKDAGYLRGLFGLVEHLRVGGSLEPLLLGKLALDDLGHVAALHRRGILADPRLRPLWLGPEAATRLPRLTEGGAGAVEALLSSA